MADHSPGTLVPNQKPLKTPCKIAFLGEAPGIDEVDQGKPFVGTSGKVLNAMLRTAGIEREDHWVGNVFGEQLPYNDVANWCVLKDEAEALGVTDLPPINGAGWLRPEHRHHLERLAEELKDVDPTVIVPLGGTALWALTGSSAIAQTRGAVCTSEYVIPGKKLVPTFHPAAVVRQWQYFTIVVGDLIKAEREAERGPKVVWPKRYLHLEPSLDDVEKWVQYCAEADLLSVDIETGWGQITCIGFADSAETAICVPFVDLRKPNKSYWATVAEEIKAWEYVKAICENDVPKLGQNYAGYDVYWLLAKMGIRTMNLQEDTRLLHHALYPELPKDLAFLGASYTEQGPWKNMRQRSRRTKRDD